MSNKEKLLQAISVLGVLAIGLGGIYYVYRLDAKRQTCEPYQIFGEDFERHKVKLAENNYAYPLAKRCPICNDDKDFFERQKVGSAPTMMMEAPEPLSEELIKILEENDV